MVGEDGGVSDFTRVPEKTGESTRVPEKTDET